MMIQFAADICGDFDKSSSREWLETNGIGGFSSSTVSGAHTRRYHGLLVAATQPPVGRAVLLSKLEETLTLDGIRYDLSANRYPGTVHPEGYKLITGFRLDPFPIWTFQVAGLRLEKSVFMMNGRNATIVQWHIASNGDSYTIKQLSVRPLIAFRDHHHLRQEGELNAMVGLERGLVTLKCGTEFPDLLISHNANEISDSPSWYRNFEYAIEQERGFDFTEDLLNPLELRFDLGQGAVMAAACGEFVPISDIKEIEAYEIERRRELISTVSKSEKFSRSLATAADQFIVARGNGSTVIAGFPWFTDWGRDTMIALNGLTLATGRPEIAKDILLEYSRHVSEGMLPNRFPDAGEAPDYNTADATLWFFEAIRALVEYTDDQGWAGEFLYEKLTDIISWHVRGTRFGIKVDTDGLLRAGTPETQLTWMDAKVGTHAITPRNGKAVEIQALWYNALCFMADVSAKLNKSERSAEYAEMAQITKESFNGQFWNADENCLFDVVDGTEKDGSIRPNQIFAVSSPHPILAEEYARTVVDKVRGHLLTPYGLRSLSPSDPRYVGTYIGLPHDRDSSYHQGPAWAWLTGPYIDAYRRVYPRDRIHINELLSNFSAHLSGAMIGQISEIFDGDYPHAPRGCPAQAWSVGELLRVLNTE